VSSSTAAARQNSPPQQSNALKIHQKKKTRGGRRGRLGTEEGEDGIGTASTSFPPASRHKTVVNRGLAHPGREKAKGGDNQA